MPSSKLFGCGLLVILCSISSSLAQDELHDIDIQSFGDEKEDVRREIQGLLGRIRSLLDYGNDTDSQDVNVRCKCWGLKCSCCQHVRISKIGLSKDCCLSISYLKQSIGLLLTFKIGSRTLFSKEISVRNPEPICVGVPFLTRGASICIQLDRLRIDSRSVGGCSRLLVRLFFVTVAKIPLGCFDIRYGDETDLPSHYWIESQQDPAVPLFDDNSELTFQEAKLWK